MLALASVASPAQTPPMPGEAALATVTNTATRTDRAADDVPATVTVTTGAQAEARGARDLKDLFRQEVDVTVRAASRRFGAALGSTGRAGNEGLNVRGLEGNQVLLLVDGVRMPQAFTFGAFAAGRGDYLFLDATAAAEVLRGPASTSFGSDGLAGALALRTLDVDDVLAPGRSQGGFLRLGGHTVDASTAATGAMAWRSASDSGAQALVLTSVRRGEATRTQGTNASPDARRTEANPLRYEQTGLLARAGFALSPTQRLGLTLEALRRDTASDVLSGRGAPPAGGAPLPATAVLRLDADDRIERVRGSVQWTLDDPNAALVQQARVHAYVQDASNRQWTFEDRNTAADRVRDGVYRERVAGLSAQAQASFVAPVPQRLSVGLDASESQIRAVRNGTVPPPGETFPSKPFPDTRYRLLGAFVQSEIDTGAFTLIPALRLDRFEMNPSAAGYVGVATPLSDSAVTPRLGAVWRLSPALQPYAQWARGFRAPTPEQVNSGFTNAASQYESIPNPNLKPERAESVELGLRGIIGPALRWQVAVYDNRYRDFINQQTVRGSFRPGDPGIFQFVNLDDARIRGAEARLTWTPQSGLSVRAAAATARGDSERNGVSAPLASVEPARVSLGATWVRGAFEWRADLLHARGKEAARIPPATPAGFAPPGYTVLDLGASWRPAPGWAVHLNLDNALDETYWRWSDVRGVPGNSTVLDAFTAPPRSVSFALRRDF